MNMILLFDEDYIGANKVCLRGRRLRHVLSVHRATVGHQLRVGHLGGLQGHGTITLLDDNQMKMSVQLDEPSPPPCRVELILALPRPKVLKRTLITATTLGIKKISLINSWRVEKSFWQTPMLQPYKIQQCLIEGLEQCRDTQLPQVQTYRLFKPFVEDVLPQQLQGRCGVIAHPHVEGFEPVPSGADYVLAIGPEGGFIPYEVDLLCQQGLIPLVLSPRILKVETAVCYAVSHLTSSIL
jgi:RsmE family RNA methyltransferase